MVAQDSYFKTPKKKDIRHSPKFERKCQMFAMEYINHDGDIRKAALAVGCTEKSADVQGYKIFHDPRTQKILQKLVKKAEEATGITFEWKLGILKKVVDKGLNHEEDKDGLFKPQGVLNAISEMNKMQGDYAPIKTETKNLNVEAEIDEIKDIMQEFKKEY